LSALFQILNNFPKIKAEMLLSIQKTHYTASTKFIFFIFFFCVLHRNTLLYV
jgi:hypothetical protein